MPPKLEEISICKLKLGIGNVVLGEREENADQLGCLGTRVGNS